MLSMGYSFCLESCLPFSNYWAHICASKPSLNVNNVRKFTLSLPSFPAWPLLSTVIQSTGFVRGLIFHSPTTQFRVISLCLSPFSCFYSKLLRKKLSQGLTGSSRLLVQGWSASGQESHPQLGGGVYQTLMLSSLSLFSSSQDSNWCCPHSGWAFPSQYPKLDYPSEESRSMSAGSFWALESWHWVLVVTSLLLVLWLVQVLHHL